MADFGLARTLELGAEIMTKNYGTLTHMPPETLTQGVVGFGTDVRRAGGGGEGMKSGKFTIDAMGSE